MRRYLPPQAFTLIELLTVIAIIAALMGLLFPAIQVALEHARKAQARTAEAGILTAVKSYQNDYSVFPAPANTQAAGRDIIYGDSNNTGAYKSEDLFNTLRAISAGANLNHQMNARRQVYFEYRDAKNPKSPKDGFAPGSASNGGPLYDPWGRTYAVAVDLNYSNVCETFTPAYTDYTYATETVGNVTETGVRAGVLVISFGKDGEQGTKGDKALIGSDDIVSWQ